MKALVTAFCALMTAVSAGACLDWEGGMGSGWAMSGTVQGDLLVLGEGRALIAADFSNPEDPVKMGSVYFADFVNSIAIKGTLAYAAVRSSGLWVVDVSDRTAPRLVNHFPTPSGAVGVRVEGTLLILSLGDGSLEFYDLSTPEHPDLRSGLEGKIIHYDVAWPYLVALVSQDGPPPQTALGIWNISDPPHPLEESFTLLGRPASSIGAAWPSVFIAAPSSAEPEVRMQVWNAGDPAHPALAGAVPDLSVDILSVHGSYLFVRPPYYSYMQMLDISDPLHPQEMQTWGPFSKYAFNMTIAFPYAFIFVGWVDFIILRVDPEQAPLELDVPLSGFYLDAKAPGSKIYAVKGDGVVAALEVLEFHSPTEVGTLAEIPLPEYTTNVFAHNDSQVYTWNFDHVQAVDVSNPLRPTLAGNAVIPSSQGIMAMTVSGTHAFLACRFFVAVLDISDPLHPRYMGQFVPPTGTEGDIRRLEAAGSQLILSDWDLLHVLDVSDPLHPSWRSSAVLDAPIQEMEVRKPLAYVLAERTGLHIFDFSDPRRIVQVGWLDFPGLVQTALMRSGDHIILNGGDAIHYELALVDVSDPFIPRLRTARNIPYFPALMEPMDGYMMTSGITLDFFDLKGCAHQRPVERP